MTFRRLGSLVVTAALLLGAPAAAKERAKRHAPPAAPATQGTETLPEVLSRFDRVQTTIRTLSAEFAQTTRNPVLKAPVEAKGRFFLTKPDSVLWEYVTPEPMRFVVAGGEY